MYTEKIIMATVYRHIRLDKNEPFYIGIGKDEKKSTWKKKKIEEILCGIE